MMLIVVDVFDDDLEFFRNLLHCYDGIKCELVEEKEEYYGTTCKYRLSATVQKELDSFASVWCVYHLQQMSREQRHNVWDRIFTLPDKFDN